MPTYDVEFRIDYARIVRIDAPDEDTACERADDIVRAEVPAMAGRLDVGLYGSAEVKREEAK